MPVSPVHRHALPVHRQAPPIQRPKATKPVATIQVHELRVLLRSGRQGIKVGADGGLLLIKADENRALVTLSNQQSARLEAKNSKLWYRGKSLGVSSVRLRAAKEGEALKVAGDPYRGELTIQADESRLLLINEISIDEYLYGVLSSEVPPNWPWAALRAQAVAARTYAMDRAAHTTSKFFDLDDSTASQVYSGTKKEHQRTNKAVDDTAGLIVTYRGKAASTFFHSNCGGHTAATRNVWSNDIAYLRGVPDLHCHRQKHSAWETEMPIHEAERRLRAASKLKGDLLGLKPYRRDDSGRWIMVRVDGSRGKVEVKSSSLRLALGTDVLRSTMFRVDVGRGLVRFEGKGWGHGIGMCQEGAKVKAEVGWKYERILQHYYPGTQVESFEDI